MALAADHGIRNYPTPAGGCLLTDENFSRRVRDLLDHSTSPTIEDMELLRVGRHFRLGPKTKLIVGRNESENILLEGYQNAGRRLYRPTSYAGPSTLAVGEVTTETEQAAVSLMVRYGDVNGEETFTFSCAGTSRSFRREELVQTEPLEEKRL